VCVCAKKKKKATADVHTSYQRPEAGSSFKKPAPVLLLALICSITSEMMKDFSDLSASEYSSRREATMLRRARLPLWLKYFMLRPITMSFSPGAKPLGRKLVDA